MTKNCSSAADAVCLLPSGSDAVEIAAHLGARTTAWWREGDRFTVATRQSGAFVWLCCALQLPLTRLPGGDVWAATVRSPDLDAAMIDITLYVDNREVFAGGEWRGPQAPPPPEKTSDLKGRLGVKDVASAPLTETRRVAIYLPPDFAPTRRYPVVYLADGEDIADAARIAEALIRTKKIPPLILAGIFSGRAAAYDRRAGEYLIGFETQRRLFSRHENFFLHEVVPLVEGLFAGDDATNDRMLFGKSNGAAWAIDTALRSPRRFTHVAGLSLCWDPPDSPRRWRNGPKFFLAAGRFETSCLNVTDAAVARARAAGADATFATRVSGHGPLLWNDLFAAALMWAYTDLHKS